MLADVIPLFAQTAETRDGLVLTPEVSTLVTGVIVPLITAFLLKASAPGWVKVLVGGLVAGIGTLVKEAVGGDGTAVLSEPMLLEFAGTWIVSVLAYLGLWNPVADHQLNAKAGPGVIGPADQRAA